MRSALFTLLAAALTGCGGGAGNPLGNPEAIDNPAAAIGQKLSFAYYQRCVYPVLVAQLRIDQGGVISTNTCAGSGCHDDTSGSGGALRIVNGAQPIDLAAALDAIRASDMYKNFYSAQGASVPASPEQSRLLSKPLLRGVLHGGGLIFESESDPNAQIFSYWISRPMPADEDEFSAAANSMFTPPDPALGNCNTP